MDSLFGALNQKASKGVAELFHLKSAEWITEMNPSRKKNSKGGSLLEYPLEVLHRHLQGTSFHHSPLKAQKALRGHSDCV